jgi:hypothetical protein
MLPIKKAPDQRVPDVNLERVKGIEPSSRAWEAFVLPLNYTREPRILRGIAGDWQILTAVGVIESVMTASSEV